MRCVRCEVTVTEDPLLYLQKSGMCDSCYTYTSSRVDGTGYTLLASYTSTINNRLNCSVCHISLRVEGREAYYYNWQFYCSRCAQSVNRPTFTYTQLTQLPPETDTEQHEHEIGTRCSNCHGTCNVCEIEEQCEGCYLCINCTTFCEVSDVYCCACEGDSHTHCINCNNNMWDGYDCNDPNQEHCNECYRERRRTRRSATPPNPLEPCLYCSENIEVCFCSVSV